MSHTIRFAALLALGLFSAPLLAAGDIEAGKARAASCAACHGADGNAARAGEFPSLAGQGATYLAKQLHDYKSQKRKNPIMLGMAMSLSDADIDNLAAYYASLPLTAGSAKAELATQGERLYRGGNTESGVAACAGCHGPAGAGIEAAGFPRLAGQNANYLALQLRAFRAAGRADIGAPAYRRNDADGDAPGMMQGVAARLSDAEIQALASYISGLSE